MRYLILVLLNVPVILLALSNIITQYKTNQTSKNRFKHQIILWLVILLVLIGSFPIYNLLSNKPILDSKDFSSFDIVQTTALVLLFYIIHRQRQHLDRNERLIRNLHQELSIKLSGNNE